MSSALSNMRVKQLNEWHLFVLIKTSESLQTISIRVLYSVLLSLITHLVQYNGCHEIFHIHPSGHSTKYRVLQTPKDSLQFQTYCDVPIPLFIQKSLSIYCQVFQRATWCLSCGSPSIYLWRRHTSFTKLLIGYCFAERLAGRQLKIRTGAQRTPERSACTRAVFFSSNATWEGSASWIWIWQRGKHLLFLQRLSGKNKSPFAHKPFLTPPAS